jgi:hypothetical protein
MAKSDKEILGHIDCPSCGTAKGMRVTHDKNGEPFGYCEAECGQQLRVGGDRYRVKAFLARFPWAAKKAEPAPAPIQVREEEPAPRAEPVAVPRSPFADALKMLGA